jgi:TPR repeat protein
VIIGGGFLLCCGLIAVILLLRTSVKPSRNGGSSVNHPSLPRQTSQITSSGGIGQDFANAQNALLRKELPSFIRNTDASRLAVWKAAAEKGTPEAQWLHGHVLLYGAHCEKAPEEALEWFRKAADQGNATAQFALGGCYQLGQSQDYTEAMKWYRKSAEQGFVPAQTSLAGFYYEGRGVPTDHAEALKWYRKAAEGGDAQAQFNL